MAKNFREASKGNFVANNVLTGDTEPSADQLKLGCLQRIADATETMAQNYVRLQNERDMYKQQSQERGEREATLERSNAALRGQITRLKNKLNKS